MKNLIFILALISTQSVLASPSVTCRTDLDGGIKGRGSNIHEARKDASLQCFDRQLAMHENVRSSLPDQETADMMIDACVNIICK